MKGQISVENIILVGIVLAILVPSVFLFYRSVSSAAATKGELQGIGSDLVTEIASMRSSGEGSWQTYTFTYRGAKGKIYTENGNELIISADQAYPFFLEKEDYIVIQDDLVVTPGKNKIKITAYEGIVCLSSETGKCNMTMCKDADKDYYSFRGKGSCCGLSGTELCMETRDCDDADPLAYPTAPALCDRKDNDCDGLIDETFDVDQDEYPSNIFMTPCSPTYTEFDCNDDPAGGSAIHPGAAEVCDGIDNDCDIPSEIDEGLGIISCADPLAGGFLGWCAAGEAQCSTGQWRCDRQPADREEDCDDTSHVDEDCDGLANDLDTDCTILFFSDYDHIPAGGPYDWLMADTCIGVSCIPLEQFGLDRVTGINDSAVKVDAGDKLQYDCENINLQQGTIGFWVKSDVPWNQATERTFLYFSNNQPAPSEESLKIFLKADNNLWLNYARAGPVHDVLVTSVGTWNIDEWFSVAVTWNAEVVPKRLAVYVNGMLVKTEEMDMNSWPSALEYVAVGAKRDHLGSYSLYAASTMDNLVTLRTESGQSKVRAEYDRFVWDYWGTCTAPGGRGDVNRNGCREINDKPLITQYLANLTHPDNATLACMDMTTPPDHFVTSADLALFQPSHCLGCTTIINSCATPPNPPKYCDTNGEWLNKCGAPENCGCPTSQPNCGPVGTCYGSSPIFDKPPPPPTDE